MTLLGVFLTGVVPDTAAPRDTERLFRSVAHSSGIVSSSGLPLLAFQKPTLLQTCLDQDDAACLDAFDCYRRMRPRIRAVRLSQHLEAAQHLLKRPSLPSSRLLCLPLTCNRLCREATPAVGPLSSDSTVPTLRRLRRFLAPARTVPCVAVTAVTPPCLFDTIFKLTTAIQHSHRLWSWPARGLPLNRPTTRPCS